MFVALRTVLSAALLASLCAGQSNDQCSAASLGRYDQSATLVDLGKIQPGEYGRQVVIPNTCNAGGMVGTHQTGVVLIACDSPAGPAVSLTDLNNGYVQRMPPFYGSASLMALVVCGPLYHGSS